MLFLFSCHTKQHVDRQDHGVYFLRMSYLSRMLLSAPTLVVRAEYIAGCHCVFMQRTALSVLMDTQLEIRSLHRDVVRDEVDIQRTQNFANTSSSCAMWFLS